MRRFRLLACLLLPLLLLARGLRRRRRATRPSRPTARTPKPRASLTPRWASAAEDDPSLDAITVGGTFAESATVEVDGPFSTETTYRRILEEGDGDPVEAGQSVDFQNVAVNGRDGTEFDNSYESTGEGGGPPNIVMDETQIIPGLVRGLLDVPVGSRVLIAIAPQDGFQAQGGIPDAGIEADDTIIFVVDVLGRHHTGSPAGPGRGHRRRARTRACPRWSWTTPASPRSRSPRAIRRPSW